MSKYAVFVLLFLGCGAASVAPATSSDPIVHSPCAPLVVAPPDGCTPLQREALGGALDAWNALGFTQLSLEGDGEPIALHFKDAAEFFHGLYDPETGEVIVNSRLDDALALQVVISHELGHAMGLPHVLDSERASVMNPGNTVIRPTPVDNEQLQARCK